MTQAALRFDGDVAVVTGAGSGLGREHALLLAARGARVVVNDVGVGVSGSPSAEHHNSATAVVDEIRSAGGSAIVDRSDVAVEPDKLIRAALDEWDRVDIVVNNAGIAGAGHFPTRSAVDFETMLRVHVLGTVGVTRAAWAPLAAVGGRVVNTTSGAVFGLEANSDYATAKGAVLGFTRAVALDAKSDGIRVNAIMPMAHTRMFAAAGGVEGSDEEAAIKHLFPARSVSPIVALLAHRSVPCSGQVFETAGGLASRVVFGLGASVRANTPEDFAEHFEELMDITDVTVPEGLADVVAAKAATLMSDGET